MIIQSQADQMWKGPLESQTQGRQAPCDADLLLKKRRKIIFFKLIELDACPDVTKATSFRVKQCEDISLDFQT